MLHSSCEEYESSTPYHALREPALAVLDLGRESDAAATERRLREVVAAADPELEPWVPLLGILLGLDLAPTPESAALDERFLREVLADVTLRFLVATLPAAPVALVVEDAQFIDDASADLLRRVARGATSLPYAFVVVETRHGAELGRARGGGAAGTFALSLLPLSEREAAEIVRDRHRRRAAATARGGGARPALGRQPPVPRRAAERRALGRDDRVAARLR